MYYASNTSNAMLFIDQSKWTNLDNSKESNEIAKLISAYSDPTARVMRIGNDTSDKSEMDHMDKLFKEARVIAKLEDPELKIETLYCVYKFGVESMVFLKETKDLTDGVVVAYYVEKNS